MAMTNTIQNPIEIDLGAGYKFVDWGTPVPSPRKTHRRRSSGVTVWTETLHEGWRGVHFSDEAAIEAMTDALIARRAAKKGIATVS